MAIVWGASSGQLKLGIEIVQSPAFVSAGTSSVQLTARYYLGSDPGYDNWGYGATLHMGGAVSGSQTVAYDSRTQGRAYKVYEHSISVPTQFGSAVRREFTARISGWYGGRAPSVSTAWSVPARPYSPPSDPVLNSASRASDSVVNLSWQVSSSSNAPVHQLFVERQENLDSAQWARIAVLNGSARSYSDTGVIPNRRYRYRVIASNGAVSPGTRYSSWVYTTPSAPVSVKAVKQADGSVRVSWVPTTPIPDVTYSVASVSGHLGNTRGDSWVHAHPPAVGRLTYTVRAVAGGLYSLPAESGPLQLLGAPDAPALLDSPVVEPNNNTVLRWAYSSADGSGQTKYQVRVKRPGSSGFQTYSIVSSNTAEATVSVGNAGQYEWQVRVWGALNPGQESSASPWSPVGVFMVHAKPVLSFLEPTGHTYSKARLASRWRFSQAEHQLQVEAEVELSTAGVLLESKHLLGEPAAYTFNTVLSNNTQYVVRGRVKSSGGLWSSWQTQAFTTSFPQPTQPEFTLTWVDSDGTVVVAVTNPVKSNVPRAESNSVYRSADGGETWELVAENIAVNSTVIDYIPPVKGVLRYKVVAYTSVGASHERVVDVTADSGFSWLNGGPGFREHIAFEYDPTYVSVANLAGRVVHRFAGREWGVEFSSPTKSRVFTISSEFEGDDKAYSMEDFFFHTGPFLFRDYRGRRFHVSVIDTQLERTDMDWWRVTVTLEQVSARL